MYGTIAAIRIAWSSTARRIKIQRGNNRQVIFCSESDYQFYLEKLAEATKKYSCDIHAYVLMINHVPYELLITVNPVKVPV